MFTIIGADGKEYGPVTAEKIREWIVAGRANAQTQARRDGEAAWSTLGSLPEFSASFGAVPPAAFGAPTAAAPTASAAGTRTVDPKAYADAVQAGGGHVDVFGTLGEAFELWKKNFWPLVGGTALIVIVQMMIGLIPLVGTLSGLFLNGVFYGGLYYYYLGKKRGQHREIGDVFAGFTRALGPLVLCSLIQAAVSIAVLVTFGAPLLGVIISAAFAGGGHVDTFPTLAPPMIGLLVIGGLLLLYLAVSFVFAFALVIDKGLGPWTAIVTSWRVVSRNWFSVFFTLLCGAILAALGVVLLFVGVFLTIPLGLGAVICAYEALFNTPAANAYVESQPLKPNS